MKVFFDSNVYVTEALLGQAAQQMIEATARARWRIYASLHLLDELAKVLTEDLVFHGGWSFCHNAGSCDDRAW